MHYNTSRTHKSEANALSALETWLDNASHQSMLGFPSDWVGNLLNSVESSESKYPPYDIINVQDNVYRIDVACAGFKEEDLSVVVEKDTLIVSGSQKQEQEKMLSEEATTPITYYHRGISKRRFERSFILGKDTKVEGAKYVNGILSIQVVKQIPPEDEPKRIEIQPAG